MLSKIFIWLFRFRPDSNISTRLDTEISKLEMGECEASTGQDDFANVNNDEGDISLHRRVSTSEDDVDYKLDLVHSTDNNREEECKSLYNSIFAADGNEAELTPLKISNSDSQDIHLAELPISSPSGTDHNVSPSTRSRGHSMQQMYAATVLSSAMTSPMKASPSSFY